MEASLPQLALALAAELEAAGVNFTHWKSNWHLGVIDGHEVELDLLVRPQDQDALRTALEDLGFHQMKAFQPCQVPDVHHYYGLESDGGCLVHIHLYYRVITGESLLKNYALPIENQLLVGTRRFCGLPVPAAEIELVVFAARVMLKHGSFAERKLLYRDYGAVRGELSWLHECGEERLSDGIKRMRVDIPELREALIREALAVLSQDVPIRKRKRVARRFRSALQPYRRFGRMSSSLRAALLISRRVRRRLAAAPASRGPAGGGRVIAFVGPEASGKSSLVDATADFFGKAFAVRTVHFGKPPATVSTAIPRLAVPGLRRLMPMSRPTRIEAASQRQEAFTDSVSRPSLRLLAYAIRSVMLARERSSLARRVSRRAASGEVILCDRFPSTVAGAADSPRLKAFDPPGFGGRVYSALVSLERSIYGAIAPPDVVIRLSVSLEDAVRRNDERIKAGKEAEEYVRRRHGMAELLRYPGVPELCLDTAGDLEETARRARLLVWEAVVHKNGQELG